MRPLVRLAGLLLLVSCAPGGLELPDASESSDAADPPDAAEFVDAGDDADAAVPFDAGDEADAGEPFDAGDVVDAGEEADAGDSADAGSSVDAGDDTDAGVAVDAGEALDAGTGADAGTPVDRSCRPALELLPPSRHALAFDFRVFGASGGTGAYRFELVENRSGAILSSLTGGYLAGDLTNVDDVVRVTDTGCEGEARATIRVVEPPTPAFPSASVLPGTALRLAMRGGSGDFAYSIVSTWSGAQVTTDGAYVAGPSQGRDDLRVDDRDLGVWASIRIDVRSDAGAVALPPVLAAPVGSLLKPVLGGGTGLFDLPSLLPEFEPAGEFLLARAGGVRSVTLQDRHLGSQVPLQLAALEPLDLRTSWIGDRNGLFAVAPPADLSGDGWPDLLVGWSEADVGGLDSGVLLLYRGGPNGLASQPDVVGTGGRGERLGTAVAVGDLDGDGHLDAVVSAQDANGLASRSGQVFVASGSATGLHGITKVVPGRIANGRFGSALAVCDVDGDGLDDLVVGAGSEESAASLADQGGVHVFRGTPTGPGNLPAWTWRGAVPDAEGVVAGRAGLLFGDGLATGDLDGDGACEVVVRASGPFATGGRAADGLVAILDGDTGGARLASFGPVRWIGGVTNAAASVGFGLAIGDLDGDGADELALGAPTLDVPGKTDAGEVRVLGGGPTAPEGIPSIEPFSALSWTFTGATGDGTGRSLSIGDATGDGLPDLVAGAPTGDGPGGRTDSGLVHLFAGRAPDEAGRRLPDVVPSATHAGGERSGNFGYVVVASGDLDRRGVGDLVVVGLREDGVAPDLGRAWLVRGEEGAARVGLGLPGGPAGEQVGQAMANVGDVDGDGLDDFVVTAPRADLVRGASAFEAAGNAWVVRSGSPVPTALGGFTLADGSSPHDTSDLFGFAASAAGDFDGDGVGDLAILANAEDRPATFPVAAWSSACPNGARSNPGAVWVFRGRRDAAPESRPAFVAYAPGGATSESLAGGFDFDGDGLDDLALGGRSWRTPDNLVVGGVMLVRGRAADPSGRTVVVCDPVATSVEGDALVLFGTGTADSTARTLQALGDLEGDGCDELAIASPTQDYAGADPGTVRVLRGFGGATCPAEPRVRTLVGPRTSAQAGTSLAAGDVDGDGIVDLVVGGPATLNGFVWLARGPHLRTVPEEPLVAVVPAAAATWLQLPTPTPIVSLLALNDAGVTLAGTDTAERWGTSVAIVPARDGAPVLVLAGATGATFAAVPNTGVVRGYRFVAGAFEPRPHLVVGGETFRPGGLFGTSVAAARRGLRTLVVAGAPSGAGRWLDDGAAYLADLPP